MSEERNKSREQLDSRDPSEESGLSTSPFPPCLFQEIRAQGFRLFGTACFAIFSACFCAFLVFSVPRQSSSWTEFQINPPGGLDILSFAVLLSGVALAQSLHFLMTPRLADQRMATAQNPTDLSLLFDEILTALTTPHRWLPVAQTQLLVTAACFCAGLILFIPGLYLWSRLHAAPLLIKEHPEDGMHGALKRSWKGTRESWPWGLMRGALPLFLHCVFIALLWDVVSTKGDIVETLILIALVSTTSGLLSLLTMRDAENF